MTDPTYNKIIDLAHLTRFKTKQDAYNEETYLGISATAAAASKLANSEAIGGATQPVYFSADGVPVATTYSLAKSVPSDAVFTDTTYDAATQSADGLMSSTDKTKLDGIDAGAEVNQNAFSSITVGSSTVSADAKTDSFTLTEGSNVTLSVSGDAITIAATDTTYSDVTADSTGAAASGLMTSDDKYKLDNVAAGAQVNVLEGVQVNGTDLAISNKKVNITFADGDSAGGLGSIKLNGTAYTVYGLGDAAAAGLATSISDGESGLVSGDQVFDYVAAELSATYKPAGSLAPAAVASSLLVAGNEGKVYNLSGDLTLDATTAALFVDGAAGEVIKEGTNIVVIDVGSSTYKFDSLAGFIDLSGYVPYAEITLADNTDIDGLFATASE